MKRVRVVMFAVLAVIGVGLIVAPSLADITVTYYWSDQKDRIIYDSDAKANLRMDCRGFASTGSCVQCGNCHTSEPQEAILRKLTQISWDKHLVTYFPKQTLSLLEGQRLSWNRQGDYYLNNRDRLLKYSRSGTLIWTAPTGSRILKNKSGEPFVVLLSGEPSR